MKGRKRGEDGGGRLGGSVTRPHIKLNYEEAGVCACLDRMYNILRLKSFNYQGPASETGSSQGARDARCR